MIFSLTGTIVDSQSKEPINGAKVSLSDIIAFSDSNGNFNINGDIEDNNLLSLIVSFSGYQFINVPIYKGDNTIKDDVGIIQLQPLIPSLEQDKLKSSQLDKDQVKNLTKSKKDISYYSQEILLFFCCLLYSPNSVQWLLHNGRVLALCSRGHGFEYKPVLGGFVLFSIFLYLHLSLGCR